MSIEQPSLFDVSPFKQAANGHAKDERSGTFVDNMKLPVHRWFRYSAGFSAEWVQQVLNDYHQDQAEFTVLDPFAGSGTTLLACDAAQVPSYGFEAHPLVYRVAKAKSAALSLDTGALKEYLEEFITDALNCHVIVDDNIPPLLLKCFEPEALEKLLGFKETFLTKYDAGDAKSELLWLLLTSILRPSSVAGTAQWQYILPNKSKSRVIDPIDAYKIKASEILDDLLYVQHQQWRPLSTILPTDARTPTLPHDVEIDLVITSPPYPNNYDYADATRLEMTYWGDVSGWSDLQEQVRQYLIRSCSQHSAAERLELDALLADEILAPIHKELSAACHQLAQVRLTKGGRKTYHTMAAAYFSDLGYVFRALRKLCRDGSTLCFVIGDSAPYGVYLHVDQWLGELACAAGFKKFWFEQTRERNTKWKNRKHRVPLKEGRLWIEG
ncbi:MAG: hypothetical protein R2911_35360 [Caldilineaceae bacterium]